MEDKARKTLDGDPKYPDDMAHRVEQLRRYFPEDFVAQVGHVLKLEAEQGEAKPRIFGNTTPGGSVDDATKLEALIDQQIAVDIARFREIQKPDGTWGFNPGTADGESWKVDGENKAEPSPTALALIAFEAAGFGPRSAQLVAVPERIEPLMQQVHRGAGEPARRPQLSEPILKMFATITGVIPDNLEQPREVFSYLMLKPEAFLIEEELKAVADAGERGKLERIQESNWYLAQKLGG
jgi:hypothetical protein